MNNPMEKRKHQRIQISLELHISTLFKQDNTSIDNIDSPIEVIDISKNGLGFKSKVEIPLDHYFNASLNFGVATNSIYCVVKVIRKQPSDNSDTFIYGCEFIGFPSTFDYIFDEYETLNNN